MNEKWWAVLGLVACLGVWASMALGPARRARVQRRWLRIQARMQPRVLAIWPWLKSRVQRPRQAQHARQEAADAIERARRRPKVDREGNVYRPDAFNGKAGDGSDKLH